MVFYLHFSEISQSTHSCEYVIAYADDITITTSGICPQMLSDKLNLALSIVLDWYGVFGLSVYHSKTETILFTRSYKVPVFTLLNINETKLTLSPVPRYQTQLFALLCNTLRPPRRPCLQCFTAFLLSSSLSMWLSSLRQDLMLSLWSFFYCGG